MHTSPVQLSRVSGTRSPPRTEENLLVPSHLPRGKRTPLSTLHTHALTRGHTHTCAHTQTPPLAGLPLRALGLNSLRVPRDWPRAFPPLRSFPSRPQSGPLPRLPRRRLTQSSSFRPPNPAGQGHEPPPPTRPAGTLGSRWNPGPRERTHRQPRGGGSPDAGAALEGAVAPRKAPSSSSPPSAQEDLGSPRPPALAKPPRAGEQGAGRAGRARSGLDEVPISQVGSGWRAPRTGSRGPRSPGRVERAAPGEERGEG